jgi:HK97 family phage prohead protease
MTITTLEVPQQFVGVQYRAADIEHLDVNDSTVLLRAAPYDHEIQLDRELWESFAPAAFAKAAAAPHRIKLHHEHSGPLIGHGIEVVDKADGIWVRAKISNTLAGQEARELARDGSLDQCSITFKPLADWMQVQRRSDGIHVRHTRGYMLGVALCAHGAYADKAFIASVRDDQADRERELRKARIMSWKA